MRVLADYGTHHYWREYDHDEALFCPHCGEKTVYVEQGAGDYYVGPTHLCVSCHFSFSLPGGAKSTGTELKIIKQLISGKVDKPKNRPGG